MVNTPTYFSTGDVLSTVILAGAGRPAALGLMLCNHPSNGPPFIGRQLIQHLVCSNPNPSCVARISAAFDNNGTGVRGCIRAVINALLLDPEQRRRQPEPANGKLREPIVHFVPWTHTFHLTAPPGKWNIPDPSDPAGRRGQRPLHAPSVFNFFAPNIVPSIGLWATTASARQSFTSATEPRSGDYFSIRLAFVFDRSFNTHEITHS